MKRRIALSTAVCLSVVIHGSAQAAPTSIVFEYGIATGGRIAMSGNAGGTVRGPMICYSDSDFTLTGSAHLAIDRGHYPIRPPSFVTTASAPDIPGDADRDGDVDTDDFAILKRNFGTPTRATRAMGDFDGDGDVDLDDFALLKLNFDIRSTP